MRCTGGGASVSAASSGSQSASERAIGPAWSNVHARGTIPRVGTEPIVGLNAEVPPPAVELDLGLTFLDLVCAEMLVYHRRFDDRRELYRPSIRGFLEYAEQRALSAEDYVAGQERRRNDTAAWLDWFLEHRIDALLEPTVPIIARPRGHGYDEAFTDVAEISLTHYWDWTGFPVATLPSGAGRRSGLPVSVSLIGASHRDWDVLAAGVELQSRL